MPISPEDYGVPNRLLLKATGSISIPEMMKAIAQYRSGEGRLTPFIFDVTEAVLDFSAGETRDLAERLAGEMKSAPLGPIAVVAVSDEVFGVGRMFQSYSNIAGRPQVGVFRDRAAAERWLGALK